MYVYFVCINDVHVCILWHTLLEYHSLIPYSKFNVPLFMLRNLISAMVFLTILQVLILLPVSKDSMCLGAKILFTSIFAPTVAGTQINKELYMCTVIAKVLVYSQTYYISQGRKY